jgi:flagellar basal-body rod protein FlgC
MEGVLAGFDIAATGMRTELARAEVVAANVANMHVTRGPDGLPYRRRGVIVEETRSGSFARAMRESTASAAFGGAHVTRVAADESTPFVPRFDPGHPHADKAGFVLMSNVDLFRELVDMSVIQRSFQANVATLQAYRGMVQSALQNLRP